MAEKTTFKKAMQRSEEIINELEKNDIELEEAIRLFEEGLQLVNNCDKQLKHFENKVQKLMETYQEDTKDA